MNQFECDFCGESFSDAEWDKVTDSIGDYRGPVDTTMCLACAKRYRARCENCGSNVVLLPTKSLGNICRDCLWERMWHRKALEGRRGVDVQVKELRRMQYERDMIENVAERGGRLVKQPDETQKVVMPDGVQFRARRPVTPAQVTALRLNGRTITQEQIHALINQWDDEEPHE